MSRFMSAEVVVGAAAIVAVVVILPILVESVRLLYAVAFCLVVPGIGWAYRWGTGDAADKFALTMLISMSATILVATAMLVTNSWSAPVGIVALVAFGVLGCVPFRRVPPHSGTHP